MTPIVLLALESIDDEDNRRFAEHLYLSYERLVYSELHKYPNLGSSIDDAFHDVIVKLYPHLQFLKSLDQNDLTNYIIRVTHNAALDHLRKEKRHRCFTLIDDLDTSDDNLGALDMRLIAIENNAAFWAAWKILDEDSQQLLSMKFQLHKTDKEIAKAFGIAVSSVHTLVTRAKKKFANIYLKQNP